MNVKELIAKLQQIDPEIEVWVQGEFFGDNPIEGVAVGKRNDKEVAWICDLLYNWASETDENGKSQLVMTSELITGKPIIGDRIV